MIIRKGSMNSRIDIQKRQIKRIKIQGKENMALKANKDTLYLLKKKNLLGATFKVYKEYL